MNQPPELPVAPAASDRGRWPIGVVLELACLAAVIPLGFLIAMIGGAIHSDWAYAGIGAWVMFGVSQWLFVIPLGIWLHARGRHDTALGLWISAGVVMLVNGACFGVLGLF